MTERPVASLVESDSDALLLLLMYISSEFIFKVFSGVDARGLYFIPGLFLNPDKDTVLLKVQSWEHYGHEWIDLIQDARTQRHDTYNDEASV